MAKILKEFGNQTDNPMVTRVLKLVSDKLEYEDVQELINQLQNISRAKQQIKNTIQSEGKLNEMNELTPQLKVQLMKNGIDVENYVQAKRFYEKKGIEKSPEELMQDIQRIKNVPMMQQAQQSAQQVGNQGQSNVVSPQQAQQQPGQQAGQRAAQMGGKPDVSKLRRRPQAEGKKITLTKGQLQEAVKKAIHLHERKKQINEIVKNEVNEQMKVRNLCEQKLQKLNEGPLDGLKSVWQGIKGAGQEMGQSAKGAVGAGKEAFAQSQASQQQQQQVKNAQKQVMDALKQASQARQKFNQEILKNAEVTNEYHDAVMGLLQTFQQAAPQMGDLAQRVEQEVTDAVGQLQYDLRSEKEQIDNFLNSLKQGGEESGYDVGSYGRAAKGKAQASREAEADEYGKSAMGKASAAVKGGKGVDFGKGSVAGKESGKEDLKKAGTQPGSMAKSSGQSKYQSKKSAGKKKKNKKKAS